MAKKVKHFKKRDVFARLQKYLYGNDYTRVCAIYGLRRTGKTTMIFQAIADMAEEDFSKTAYIKIRVTDKMSMVIRDLDKLQKAGFEYVFIDEVTLMEDFIDSASLFSDIYTQMGMKIVLSGTDSLGFWFAQGNELYDRVRMVHTTFIPYKEYCRLLDINSIDEYIRYGGTLRMGETDFDDEDLLSEDASFRDDESTRRYIDTAICKNIQHSLACFEYGNYFSHLYSLYDAGELTNAINRIIEDMNHRFLLSVLTKDFKSHDFGITASNLHNREQLTVPLTDSHVAQTKMYLKSLDLIVDCPIEHGEVGIKTEEHVLFTQPGMRYSQAQALVYSLLQDETFKQKSVQEKEYVTNRILEEVRGRMLEDIILLEALKALGKNYRVFKLQFGNGEFDMVIRDNRNNTCAIYEIKHSKEYVKEQARHLIDEEKLSLTTQRYGTLVGRYVLYLGEDFDTEDGIAYRNAEEFLKNLPNINASNACKDMDTESADVDLMADLEMQFRSLNDMQKKRLIKYMEKLKQTECS